jgi:hypothetical protein
MSLLIVYLISLVVVGMLAKKGMIMPYSAGALGIFIAAFYQVPYRPMIFIIISLYLICSLGNGIPEAEGISMDTAMLIDNGSSKISANPIKTFFAKCLMLVMFIFIPLPPPSVHIPGLFAMILISVMLYMNRQNHAARDSFLGFILAIGIQAGLIAWVSMYVESYTDDLGGAMAIMCCLSIPGFLFPSLKAERDLADHQVTFRIVPTIFAAIFAFYTPGLTSSAVASSFFPPDQHRLIGVAALEGAIEGYIIHLIMGNYLSHKSPLGDLLGSQWVNWGQFTCDFPTILWILAAVAIGIAGAIFSPCLSFAPSRTLSVSLLMMQGILTGGSSTWLFILVGFICLFIRRKLCRYSDETIATAFIIPTIFG